MIVENKQLEFRLEFNPVFGRLPLRNPFPSKYDLPLVNNKDRSMLHMLADLVYLEQPMAMSHNRRMTVYINQEQLEILKDGELKQEFLDAKTDEHVFVPGAAIIKFQVI